MHVFTINSSSTASISFIKLTCRATLFNSLGQSHLFTYIRSFLYYFVKLNYLGFANLDKTNIYLKSDKIQDSHQPVKNRPRPKRRHTFIAVRNNERNNGNAACFAFSKSLCKKMPWWPQILFRFFFLLSSQELHPKIWIFVISHL